MKNIKDWRNWLKRSQCSYVWGDVRPEEERLWGSFRVQQSDRSHHAAPLSLPPHHLLLRLPPPSTPASPALRLLQSASNSTQSEGIHLPHTRGEDTSERENQALLLGLDEEGEDEPEVRNVDHGHEQGGKQAPEELLWRCGPLEYILNMFVDIHI